MSISIDPIAGLVGLVSIIVPIMVTIWQFRKNRKSLSYSVITRSELIDLEELSMEEVKLSYGEEELKTLNQLIVRVENTGNKPIEEKDYVSDLIINCEISYERPIRYPRPEKLIVSAQCIDKSSDAMSIKLITDSDKDTGKVSVKPILLNPKDWFVIQIISSIHLKSPQVLSRIVAMNDIQEARVDPSFFQGNIRTLTIVFGVMQLFLLIFYTIFLPRYVPSEPYVYTPPTFISIFSLFSYLVFIPFAGALIYTFMEHRLNQKYQ